MELFLRIDINLAAIFVLGIIAILAYRRLDRKNIINRTFLLAAAVILFQTMIETLTCIINKQPYTHLIPLAYLLHMLLFSLAPGLTCFWCIMVFRILFPGSKRKAIREVLLLLPIISNAVVIFLSPRNRLGFYIDSENVYHRGEYFLLFSLLIYLYLFISLLLLLFFHKKLQSRDMTPLLIFNSIPFLGGILQTMFYGTLFMWSSVAFSLVVVFFFLQQRMIRYDSLTGAWDRSSFETYIEERSRREVHFQISLIYLDIDRLKQINDIYGHTEGDFAIKKLMDIIKSVLRNNDSIVRMGGDEFIILIDGNNPEIITRLITRLETALDKYNQTAMKEYKLSCSFGGAVFDSKVITLDSFIHQIDAMMYESKKEKKAREQEES